MVVLACGDRNWCDYDIIREELRKLPRNTLVVHGDCRGADRIAGMLPGSWDLRLKLFQLNGQSTVGRLVR